MRFWIVEMPALIITVILRAYLICLTAMTVVCLLSVIWSLLALPLDWPRPW